MANASLQEEHLSTASVELQWLRYGHDERAPGGLTNPRKANRSEGIEQLAASILAHGIIQPLAVVAGDGGYFYVAEGNRRLRALEGLKDDGRIDAGYSVPVRILAAGSSVSEAALAANIVRVPLHEADQYEAFRALADEGLSEAAIASRFAIDAKRVRRILALGGLSSMILQAWRDGKLGHHTEETVRAFTLAPSLKDQERAFKKLSKNGNLYASAVRQEFGANKGDAGRYLTFIGKEAYEAAGGGITEDLFGTNHVISDAPLAKQLADEKLSQECERLVAEGWSWAAPLDDLPVGARWQWPTIRCEKEPTPEEAKRLDELQAIMDADDDQDVWEAASTEVDEIEARIESRGFSAEAKAKSGCILSLGNNGQLEIRAGVMKPSADRQPSRTETKVASKDKADAMISNALVQRLSAQLTQAAAKAVRARPSRAFEISIAALIANKSFGMGARLNHGGMASRGESKAIEFKKAYLNIAAMDTEQQLAALAEIVGQSFDFQTRNINTLPLKDESVSLICEVLGHEMVDAVAETFDAEDYFRSVSKPLILKAIAEALGADAARRAGTKPKADLVQLAVSNVPASGWLPPELRTSHYAGPGAAAAKQAKPKAKAKPTAKKAPGKKAPAPKAKSRAKGAPETARA
ncbi:ParB/RepB/Spo0J family partition protein [Microvirga sp. RSM25]|uniref:ParB/RepB/Spo0J family partition protein n=1 Tax=Microvirga sp. RSM25 TaxID=3273802 RepID=UPI00384D832F